MSYYYQVQVALNPQFQELVVNAMVESVTDYSVPESLEPFTVYYWRVKTIDAQTGATSEWSTTCVFRIKAADVIIEHDIDKPTPKNSYIWYGSGCFGLNHKFIRSYDVECVIPDAVIGLGMCNDTMDAIIGSGYCHGVCLPEWDGYEIEYLLTEDSLYIETESGVRLILEF